MWPVTAEEDTFLFQTMIFVIFFSPYVLCLRVLYSFACICSRKGDMFVFCLLCSKKVIYYFVIFTELWLRCFAK